MTNARGHAAVLTTLLLPLLAVCIFLVADTAHQVVTKLSLQVAADRAAYAGAERLSAIMNTVAGRNWAIRQKFLALQEEMTATTMRQSEKEGRWRIKQVQREIDDLREEMDDLVAGGYAEADAAARTAAEQWAPGTRLEVLYGEGRPLFGFGATDDTIDLVEPDEQWPEIEYHWPEGGEGVPDPASQEAASRRLLQYRVKAPQPDGRPEPVSFAVRLSRDAPPSTFPSLFRDRPMFRAAAAAQPYGGSIEATAFVAAESEEAAVEARPYRPTLIPLEVLRDTARGYRGLADETPYLH